VNAKQTIVLFVLVLGALMEALDSTIVILAGGLSREFITEMDSAPWSSLILLAIAGVMSVSKEEGIQV
jgi:hypothetical protein